MSGPLWMTASTLTSDKVTLAPLTQDHAPDHPIKRPARQQRLLLLGPHTGNVAGQCIPPGLARL